jgi:hypothetical protein
LIVREENWYILNSVNGHLIILALTLQELNLEHTVQSCILSVCTKCRELDSGTHPYTCVKRGKIIIQHFIPKKENDGAIQLPVRLRKDEEGAKEHSNSICGCVRPETASCSLLC